ncbi:MAG: hypothetical protein LC798_20865 [Chloroflexi bacterium]|nr:hypothetical protein [Chloroflexota bacterium]
MKEEFARLAREDPEFAKYVRELDPATPLLEAMEGYIAMLKARVRINTAEAEAGEEVVRLMRARGYEDTGQLLEAYERGEVELSESAWESLTRMGVIGWDRESES